MNALLICPPNKYWSRPHEIARGQPAAVSPAAFAPICPEQRILTRSPLDQRWQRLAAAMAFAAAVAAAHDPPGTSWRQVPVTQEHGDFTQHQSSTRLAANLAANHDHTGGHHRSQGRRLPTPSPRRQTLRRLQPTAAGTQTAPRDENAPATEEVDHSGRTNVRTGLLHGAQPIPTSPRHNRSNGLLTPNAPRFITCKKQHRAQRLVLHRRADPSVDRKPREKRDNRRCEHRAIGDDGRFARKPD